MKKLDIVYILKNNPPSEELRYSIRSVVKNFPYERIVFIGGKPEDIEPDLYIPLRRNTGTKWKKATENIIKASTDPRISEDFWLFNDDFFVMKPVRQFLPAYHGTLEERAREIEAQTKGSPYAKRLRVTERDLKQRELPTLNYAVHMPMMVNKTMAREVFRAFPQNPMFRSLYGNYCSLGGRDVTDVKVNILGGVETKFDKRRQFLSTSDKSFNSGRVGEYIRSQFTEPTQYEKG